MRTRRRRANRECCNGGQLPKKQVALRVLTGRPAPSTLPQENKKSNPDVKNLMKKKPSRQVTETAEENVARTRLAVQNLENTFHRVRSRITPKVFDKKAQEAVAPLCERTVCRWRAHHPDDALLQTNKNGAE